MGETWACLKAEGKEPLEIEWLKIEVKEGRREFLANTNCSVPFLLQYARHKVGLPDSAPIDLCDEAGTLKLLFTAKFPGESAAKYLPPRGIYYVCRLERGPPGSRNESAYRAIVPILEDPGPGLLDALRAQCDYLEKNRLKLHRGQEKRVPAIDSSGCLSVSCPPRSVAPSALAPSGARGRAPRRDVFLPPVPGICWALNRARSQVDSEAGRGRRPRPIASLQRSPGAERRTGRSGEDDALIRLSSDRVFRALAGRGAPGRTLGRRRSSRSVTRSSFLSAYRVRGTRRSGGDEMTTNGRGSAAGRGDPGLGGGRTRVLIPPPPPASAA
uniref:Uncharacterized protein n=1 Tax=Ornithorhynchus anatinus TaxID=9258 RepID=A0A6I8NKL0_ORNAN